MSDVPRSLPLFESLVVFENYPVEPSLQQSLGTLDIRNVRTVEQTNYPITVFGVVGSELSLKISYDCHRFAPTTITQMLGHFQTLLEGMVDNPNQRLWELPLLTASERQQLLVEWNDTQSDYLKEQSIRQLLPLNPTGYNGSLRGNTEPQAYSSKLNSGAIRCEGNHGESPYIASPTQPNDGKRLNSRSDADASPAQQTQL